MSFFLLSLHLQIIHDRQMSLRVENILGPTNFFQYSAWNCPFVQRHNGFCV